MSSYFLSVQLLRRGVPHILALIENVCMDQLNTRNELKFFKEMGIVFFIIYT